MRRRWKGRGKQEGTGSEVQARSWVRRVFSPCLAHRAPVRKHLRLDRVPQTCRIGDGIPMLCAWEDAERCQLGPCLLPYK